MPRPLLLDVDTGVDDAVAIALASTLEQHRLIALTTVAGNVEIEHTTRNTQRVASWLGLNVPIYRGMSKPVWRRPFTAGDVHGNDGLGGWDLDVPLAPLSSTSAPEAMLQVAREHAGEITFVCVGPLSNLAVALSLEPKLAEWVDRLVIMGGAFSGPGNITNAAEFNIWIDPEAAAQVARSAMPATWVPLDSTHQTGLTRSNFDALAGKTDPRSVLVREASRRLLVELEKPRFHLHDPLAIAVAEDPSVTDTESGRVLVDIGPWEPGRTLLTQTVGDDTVARVTTKVNLQRFGDLLGRVADIGELEPAG